MICQISYQRAQPATGSKQHGRLLKWTLKKSSCSSRPFAHCSIFRAPLRESSLQGKLRSKLHNSENLPANYFPSIPYFFLYRLTPIVAAKTSTVMISDDSSRRIAATLSKGSPSACVMAQKTRAMDSTEPRISQPQATRCPLPYFSHWLHGEP